MPHRTITQTNAASGRRRRPPRPLNPFGAIPEEHTAAAIDDQQAVEELMDDLLALVDVGLITPTHEHGGVRYAATDSERPDQAR